MTPFVYCLIVSESFLTTLVFLPIITDVTTMKAITIVNNVMDSLRNKTAKIIIKNGCKY